MRRRPNVALDPEDALAAWDAAPAAGPAAVTAHCTLLTPLYGGGVTPGEVDCEMPIRPSALRGQLRFWWRLLHGRDRPTEVFQAESALWGGISSSGPRTSLVTLQVRAEPVGMDQLIKFKPRARQDFPAYSLILEKDDDPDVLEPGYAFDLTLRFHPQMQPEQRAQVVEALRWWASFGGVGARTRRGLGAVHVTSDDNNMAPVMDDEVKSRGGWMHRRPARPTAIAAWKDAVDALSDYRQKPGVGRDSSHGNRPGRSRWPEPDAIRRLTKSSSPGHEPRHEVKDFYPRAAFGLPIVFHFKAQDVRRGDPRDQVLQPGDRGRMASPLILKPYFDGAGYRPIALLLPGWEQCVSVYVGLDANSASPAWPSSFEERKRQTERIAPMDGRGDDALSAFMTYFAERTADRDRTRRAHGTRRR